MRDSSNLGGSANVEEEMMKHEIYFYILDLHMRAGPVTPTRPMMRTITLEVWTGLSQRSFTKT